MLWAYCGSFETASRVKEEEHHEHYQKEDKPKEKAPAIVAEVPNKVLIKSTTNKAINIEVEFIKAKVIEPKLHKVKFCTEVYYNIMIIGK